jgi:hypothetical protein
VNWLKKYFYFFPVLLYLPALGNFFSGDDWFHLRISQISSLQEFFNFFSFTANAQTASFYRPISTQVFFFVFQKLFGLTAWPYYLFGLALFTYSIYLVRKFSCLYLKSSATGRSAFGGDICNLTSVIYALSVSNFTRVYFLSAYQELFLVVFSLLTLINFAKKPLLSILFFVLALLSKETAIVLPLLIFIFNYKDLKKNSIYLISVICISAIYLYFRLFHFGLAAGDSYIWNFSPAKTINTLMWYVLWSFGAPELLVDYVGSGLKLVPRFFTDYVYWWRIIIFPLIITILSTIVLGFKKLYHHFQEKDLAPFVISLLKFKAFFLITLLPVLFLPSHKFTLELGLPLVGFSLIIAWLLPKKFNALSFCFFVFFILLNLSMNYLTYTRHYSVSRGEISKKVYEYFNVRSAKYPESCYFQFKNDFKNNGEIWGQSKQISQSLSGSEFFKVYYENKSAEVFYEDNKNALPADKKELPLSTAMFLNN